LRWIGYRLGKSLDPGAVEETASRMVELTRQALTPRAQALEVLDQLRGRGLKTGLISDCGPAVPLVWEETPFPGLFDAVIFSCRAGLKKPDAKIYQLALDGLNLQASECLYIGDGHGGELEGAREMGMKTALIWSAIEPEEPERLVVQGWKGPILKTLDEVLRLLVSD